MIFKHTIPLLAFLAAAVATPAPAVSQTNQLVGNGSVDYQLVHKFHKISATSHAMAVRGTVDAAGLKLMARAQVGTFDSGNSNRDAHMMETVEGERYPWVSVRGVLPGFKLPTIPGTTKMNLQASVELHGIAVNHPIDVILESKDGIHFQARFTFSESLTEHKIERPSLLFVPVDDLITITGKADVTIKS